MRELNRSAEVRQMFTQVGWHHIDLERFDGDFRKRHVALFRKYEGLPLIDSEGMPVFGGNGKRRTVSQRAFAEHCAIPQRTFNDWCTEKRADTARVRSLAECADVVNRGACTIRDLDRELAPVQAGIVAVFRKYEGTPLCDEDGEPILDDNGERRTVDKKWFAEQIEIEEWALDEWCGGPPDTQAFLFDSVSYEDMSDAEKAEWCRRVKYVLSADSNERFGGWSPQELAPVLGLSEHHLRERLGS